MNPEPKTEEKRALACLPEAPKFLQDVMGSGEVQAAMDASSKEKVAPYDLQAKYRQLESLRVKIATMIERAAKPETSPSERQQCYMLSSMYGQYAQVVGMLLMADALTVADRMKSTVDDTKYIKRFGVAGLLDQLDELMEWSATFQQRSKTLDSKGEPVALTKPVGHGVLELMQVQLAMLKRLMRFMATHADDVAASAMSQRNNEAELFAGLDALGVPIQDIFAELDIGTVERFMASRRRRGQEVEPLTPDSIRNDEEMARAEAERELQATLPPPGAKP